LISPIITARKARLNALTRLGKEDSSDHQRKTPRSQEENMAKLGSQKLSGNRRSQAYPGKKEGGLSTICKEPGYDGSRAGRLKKVHRRQEKETVQVRAQLGNWERSSKERKKKVEWQKERKKTWGGWDRTTPHMRRGSEVK